jgi:hypothetical protein
MTEAVFINLSGRFENTCADGREEKELAFDNFQPDRFSCGRRLAIRFDGRLPS